MISFFPGPSQVESRIQIFVKDAYKNSVLSMNHRSPEFEAICKRTVGLLKQKLSIPKSYTIFFTSSATECWEIVAQSLVTTTSIHIYNGAFGEKWFDYVKKIRPESVAVPFDRDEMPAVQAFAGGEMICLTQNETSNGTQLSMPFIRSIKKSNPHHLVVVDAVSSMAGIKLDFSAADIWLASVQKCFGMPAGLGLMVLSPRAMSKVRELNERHYYNSLALMDDMMKRWQTSFTPNVMAIYLLMRIMEERPTISEVHRKTLRRFHDWDAFFHDSESFSHLVGNSLVRSNTVLTIQADPDLIVKLKAVVRKKGFLLGSGYGALKPNTFRIANFPALKEKEIRGLKSVLKPFL